MLETRPFQVCLICSFCSSDRGFASDFFQTPPHDGRPCLWLTVPTAKPVADFHRQVITRAEHTTIKPAALVYFNQCRRFFILSRNRFRSRSPFTSGDSGNKPARRSDRGTNYPHCQNPLCRASYPRTSCITASKTFPILSLKTRSAFPSKSVSD